MATDSVPQMANPVLTSVTSSTTPWVTNNPVSVSLAAEKMTSRSSAHQAAGSELLVPARISSIMKVPAMVPSERHGS